MSLKCVITLAAICIVAIWWFFDSCKRFDRNLDYEEDQDNKTE